VDLYYGVGFLSVLLRVVGLRDVDVPLLAIKLVGEELVSDALVLSKLQHALELHADLCLDLLIGLEPRPQANLETKVMQHQHQQQLRGRKRGDGNEGGRV